MYDNMTIINRKNSHSRYFIILILSLWPNMSFAQQLAFSPRENIIFATLNRLQGKEEAIRDSMKEAQMKLIKDRYIDMEVSRVKGINFKDLASRAHPYLSQETVFNGNINANTENKTAVANTLKPGLKMNFSGSGKALKLDMSVNNSYCNNRPANNLQEAEIDLLSNFSLGRYNLVFSEDYSNNYLANSRFVSKDFVRYWKNTFAYQLGSQFNRLRFDIGYKRSDYDYEPDHSFNDQIEETYSLNQYLLIATKTRLSLEYSYERLKYKHKADSSGDSRYNDYNLALSNVLSDKLTDLIGMDYKVSDSKMGSHDRDFTLTGNIAYRISERTDLALNLSRLFHKETSEAGDYIENSIGLSGNHRLAFNPKFSISFGGGAIYQDYNKATDSAGGSDIYSLNLGLTYAFRHWLDFGLDYAYDKTNYESAPGSYHNNTVTFKTAARF